MIKNPHIGSFDISIWMIENRPDVVMSIMKDMIITRAECIMVEDCISYQAISEKYFDSIIIGQTIPKYKFIKEGKRILVNRLS
jgi:hypothetical protein